MNIIPRRNFFVTIELALLLGLCEEIMFSIVLKLQYSHAIKALILMAGTAGMFSLVLSIVRPLAEKSLKTIAKADEGSQLSRLIIHCAILAAIYFAYVNVFF